MNLRLPAPGKRGGHVVHLLSDYIDGCLSARATRGVEAHLAGCPVCARELDEWRSLLHLVSRHASIRCPIDCADVVLQRLAESGERRAAQGSPLRVQGEAAAMPNPAPRTRSSAPPFALRSPPSRPALWTATAVLLAALLGGLTWRHGHGTPRASTSGGAGGIASHALPAPAMHGAAPERLDGAFGRSDSLILASDFAAEE